MRVTTVSITYARTFNLGDYSSARFEIALSAELEHDGEHSDDVQEAQAELWALAKDSIKTQAMPVLKKREDEISAIRASLPAGTIQE